MLEGIAFVTIVIAAITSTFVARAAKERGIAERRLSTRPKRGSRPGWIASTRVSTGSKDASQG